jgi:hypothetical protein
MQTFSTSQTVGKVFTFLDINGNYLYFDIDSNFFHPTDISLSKGYRVNMADNLIKSAVKRNLIG